MRCQNHRSWLLGLLAALTALALLSGATLAAGDGSGTFAPEDQESQQEAGGETAGGEETSGEETGEEEEEEEPEPTLEELRDQLLAILGGGEETAAIQADIDRLISLGDPGGTLRTYLESSIRLHQIQYEMEQLQSTLEGLEAADEAIGSIGQAMTVLENPDEVLSRIREEISDQAARLLEAAEYDGTGELADLAVKALDYLGSGAAGGDSADMAAILLFHQLRQGELLSETGMVTAQDAITSHFGRILSRAAGLAAGEREALEAASRAIAARANNAQAMDPGTLVAAGREMSLRLPVFTYSGTIMLSLEDAAAFLGGEVVEMEDNDTVVLQAPGVVLEMTRGSSDAYRNDRLLKLDQPVLYFDGACYLPLDTMLQCCGMERMTVAGYQLLYPAL